MGLLLNDSTIKAPAGFWLRAGAYMIDGVLLSAILTTVTLLYKSAGLPSSSLLGLLWSGLAAGYLVWLPVAWKGQTVGKRAAGIAVVTMDGSPLTYRLFLKRWVGYCVSALPLGAGFLAAAFTREKRTFHDFISGTRVVCVRETGLPRKAAVISVAILAPLAAILVAVALPSYRAMAIRARSEGLKQNPEAVRQYGEPGGQTPEKFGLEFVADREDGAAFYDKRGNADIFLPKGYDLVAPVPNRQVTYDFGMKHRTENYEIRVRFDRPLGVSAGQRKELERTRPGSKLVSFVDPGKPSTAWAQSMGINLSGQPVSHFEIFPDKAVKKEFGADWGVTSEAFGLKDPDFAGRYSFARIAAQVLKKDAGSYTIFQLFNSTGTDAELRDEAFHIVKFRQE